MSSSIAISTAIERFRRFLGANAICEKHRESEDDAVAIFDKEIYMCNPMLITHPGACCRSMVDDLSKFFGKSM